VPGDQAFDSARDGAESEVILVAEQVATAQLFAEPARLLLSDSGSVLADGGRPEIVGPGGGVLDAEIRPGPERRSRRGRA
jgi:hypothetical protein